MNTKEIGYTSSPAAQLMAIEVLTELLVSTSPQELGKALTNYLRELTGAKTVMVLAHKPEPELDELLHISPLRRAELFSPIELNYFCYDKTPGELPYFSVALPEHHPLKTILVNAGIQSMARYSLHAGGEAVGLLLMFDMPGVERIDETNLIISRIAPPIALALKNSLAFFKIEQLAQELERRVDERTAELSKSEERYRILAQRLLLATTSAHLGVWDWNVRDNTMVWDDRMFELYGITRDVFPNNIDAWMNGLHPDDKERAVAECQAAMNGGNEFDTVFRVRHPDGSVKHLKANGLVINGENCKAERMIGINIDISEATRAEEEKVNLQNQLLQAQKMESVGRLAGGVAHDFNNMLTVILGNAHLGLMKLDPNHPVCANLKEISTTAERSADLTRQLLAFARKQTVAPIVMNLNSTVTDMIKMLQRLIGEDIRLSWQPSPEPWQIRMDPSQIDQILANLCVNARDAIDGTGSISIGTDNRSIDTEYCLNNLEATPGEYVCLSVSDSGSGMNKETQAHIFEPFFTTKESGKGTGLGLATVYGAVKQNGGFINIYSEPGQGTTFSIYLPRDESSRNLQAPTGIADTPTPRGQETILLVEDEPSILKIAAIMLAKQGYTVLKAETPGEAIRLAREHVGDIHLLMTDVIMPEMNGRDLAKNLLSIYPNMKRLFMSGYTADVIANHGVLEEGVNFIQKPFSLPDMAAKVREVLDSN